MKTSFWDLPVLSLFGLGLLVASGHLGLGAGLPGRADLDGGVLKRSRRDGHLTATLKMTEPLNVCVCTVFPKQWVWTKFWDANPF